MWLVRPCHALLACIFLVQVGILSAANSPQVYYNGPNGKLEVLNNAAQNICGECPPGTNRELVSGPYCGRCVAASTTCAAGYYLNNNGQCLPCPCPGTNGDRKFGTSCRVDRDGQVTCDCPSEYAGRDCSQCAPGAIQNNQYPYNCYRLNSTNSFSVTCPAGNRCSPQPIQQIVQQRPTCPYTTQPVVGTGCPYTNQTQTGLCPVGGCQQTPCQSNGCQPCQTGGCQNGGCGSPCQNGGTPCNQNGGCPGTPCQQGGCPGTPCPGNGNGSSQCGCPSPCGCPPNGCPGSCPPNPPGTVQPPCPIGPPPPPPVITPPIVPPIIPPIVPPCPIGPSPCPGNGGCPGTPGCPGGTGGCPVNPVNPGCPGGSCGGCPIPPPPCNINPPTPCQTACPNPCAPCPQIPACPDCRVSCPPCPAIEPCPPCGEGGCVTCPNPCLPCPPPCRDCPSLTCAPCNNNTCPPCICNPGNGTIIIDPPIPIIEPCICDPRGTSSQLGNQCFCKVNVQGLRCDQCKPGYFGLSSSRPEGCLACFCSGLTTSCSLTPYYRDTIRTNTSPECTIELTDESHTVVYSKGASGFNWDGQQATLSKSVNTRLFWSLPACLKGNRVSSYGGILSFTRVCSGSGSPTGADHEVMLVSSSGTTIFWTTFEPQTCDGKPVSVDVLLTESAYWSSWKGEQYRRAARGDIMEVLADLQLILVRATFTTNTMTTSIRNVSMSTVSHAPTSEGIALQVESCRCPTGYRGLSCENCAPGYYRDTTDMTKSVFGACKPCPCGSTSDGCHFSNGKVVCKCKPGFTGPLCQAREVITVTCDPFWIREVEGALVDFTCSFTTNSKRTLLMRLGKEGSPSPAEETTSLTQTIKLEKNIRRVACEVVDKSGVTWAAVYCAIDLIPVTPVIRPPPPRMLAIIPKETFMCVEEGESVALTCDMHHFGARRIVMEWRREGNSKAMGSGPTMTIHNARPVNAGTYICSASDGDVTGAGQIALMVRSRSHPMRDQYPVNGTGPLELDIHRRHGGDYPNYPFQADTSYQKDQPDAPSGNLTEADDKIGPLPPGHPVARVDPAEVKAKPGDMIILRCNATGQEPLKFYWKSGANDYIPVHVRISHGALIFRSLRSQDAGVYYCVAWNHLGQSTARATITLDNSIETTPPPKPGKPDVEVLHPEITAKVGENVNFQCRSNQTGIKYKWSKLDGKLPNSSDTSESGVLTLYRVSWNDKGTYLCSATNKETGEETTAQAVLKLRPMEEVVVPPRVIIKPKSPLRARTGERVRLECESIGSPMPNVSWVRSIDGQDKRLVSSPTNQAIYEIKQASVADVGKYMCIAVSTAGRKSESMSLVIDDGKPCKDNEFRCKSGDQCIPRDDRCDSEKDCKDGSDEENCKGSRRIRRHAKQF